MKKAANIVGRNRRLTAWIIMAATALYLMLTSAIAQSDLVSSIDPNITYTPDYLS